MVDELIMYDSQIEPNHDVTMRGHVSWVGKTSIEVDMVMSQFGRDFLATKFLMVARDASGKKFVLKLKFCLLNIEQQITEVLFYK